MALNFPWPTLTFAEIFCGQFFGIVREQGAVRTPNFANLKFIKYMPDQPAKE
jgi:hypothetical protein